MMCPLPVAGWVGREEAVAFLRAGACPAGPVLELVLDAVERRSLLPSVSGGRGWESNDPWREAGLPEVLRPASQAGRSRLPASSFSR
jgi:hypothetical protein